MSAEDFAELKRAADVLWPGAILTNSSVILGLAKVKASDVLNPALRPRSQSHGGDVASLIPLKKKTERLDRPA